MNRRSIVAPLILIALGGAFLANNVLPDFQIFRMLATYWPFVLIAWGALRLVEVLALAATSRALPARGLGGGEIFLIVLICFFGATTNAVSRHLPNFRIGSRGVDIFGESYDYPLEYQKPVADKARIVLDNLRGNIRVTGGDAKELKITGRKTIRSYDRPSADRINNDCKFEVATEGDRVVVRTNQERVAENRHISADLEVSVPRGASIEGRGRYGDFDITEIDGTVEIISDNAGVRLSKLGGNAKIELGKSDIVRAVDVKGNVEITGKRTGGDVELENIQGLATVTGSFSGNLDFKNLAKPFRFESSNTEMRVEKLPGHINMNLGNLTLTNGVGPIRLTSRSKDIKVEEFTESLELDVQRGDIELRPAKTPLPKITARCRSVGNIELALPASAKFDLTASTERGEARNDYGDPIKSETEGRAATLKGKAGSGPVIQVSTTRGSVTVRKE
ncbi:MAG: DUF4097 family beta strand repeat protein [Acidobacteria bacterium]|nr:DUF4097 family beta strand repeat protein [Acidobacteriota bacterium]